MNHGAKPRTLQRRISCLKENYITADFMAGIQSPKMDKKLRGYMLLKELQKLFIMCM